MPIDDSLAGKDPEDLTEDEQRLLNEQRSLVSREEYNPDEVAPEEIVVELPDHSSWTQGELAAKVDDENFAYPALAQEAVSTLADVNQANEQAAATEASGAAAPTARPENPPPSDSETK